METCWEIDRYDWAKYGETGLKTRDALIALASCPEGDDGAGPTTRLEDLVVRFDNVKPGAAEAVSCLLQILQTVTPSARAALLELLLRFAVGTCGGTAADPAVVQDVIAAFAPAVPSLARALQYGDADEAEAAVDTLDCIYRHPGADQEQIVHLFRRFSQRGPKEAWRIGHTVVFDTRPQDFPEINPADC